MIARRSGIFKLVLLIGLIAVLASAVAEAANKPNIVFLLADDLGYTDIAP